MVRHALHLRQLTGFHVSSAILCLPVDFDQSVGASWTWNSQSCSSADTRNILAYRMQLFITKRHAKSVPSLIWQTAILLLTMNVNCMRGTVQCLIRNNIQHLKRSFMKYTHIYIHFFLNTDL